MVLGLSAHLAHGLGLIAQIRLRYELDAAHGSDRIRMRIATHGSWLEGHGSEYRICCGSNVNNIILVYARCNNETDCEFIKFYFDIQVSIFNNAIIVLENQ